MTALFWICLALVAYPYAIYPALLVAFNRLLRRRLHHPPASAHWHTVSIILPVHNEAGRIREKIANTLALDYPREKLQIIVVGDACTDNTLERAKEAGQGAVEVVPLSERRGKAAGLNAGLARATGDILVFTDAGIALEPQSLAKLVAHFSDPSVGCVSGEDYVEGGGGEGLYGRLELLLRREEARLHSIAGASGCFYALRRNLCKPFRSGMAPDFLSVLDTVRSGHRALAEPLARGTMTATQSQSKEFSRKARTFLRGLTALFGNAGLLNPFRYPAFAFILWSHKVMRWFAPAALAGCLLTALFLALDGRTLYVVMFWGQIAFYLVGLLALMIPRVADLGIARICAFFLLVNVAAAKALILWLAGVRQEVWQPTRRQE